MAGILEELGYALSDNKAEADLIIFNTCCVREHAELRVFGNVGALKAVKDERPNTIIAVCGCMMQQREVAQRLYKRYPFVDIIFGTNELQKLPSMLAQAIQGERVMLIMMTNMRLFQRVYLLSGQALFCQYKHNVRVR